MKTIETFGLAAIACCAVIAEAQANATLLDNATIEVAHGRSGKATSELSVSLPEGFEFAKPEPSAGRELEVTKGGNDRKTVDACDPFTIRDAVKGVDRPSRTFPLEGFSGDAAEKMGKLEADGGDAHGPKDPVPTMILVAGTDHGDHSMAGMNMSGKADPAGNGTAKAGDLDISGGYVKAMLPGQPVGGGYLTIHNGGGAPDRLISVKSPAAGKVELHEMKTDNNIMQMRELKEGIAIAPGATVSLAPNGLHMMFKQVKARFKQGDTVSVMLTFEKAGTVELILPVLSPKAN
jgi:periplasmic copper chaperone A